MLSRDFFNRSVVEVAKDLLGQILVFNEYQGIILETEAYGGENDPASHAFKKTPRSSIMFGAPGVSYVYFIYGMYHCFNIVAEEEGHPGAVLIRSLNLFSPVEKILDGPGKLCKEIGITKNENNVHLIDHPYFYLKEGSPPKLFETTPRIGIKKGVDKLWRFRSLSF